MRILVTGGAGFILMFMVGLASATVYNAASCAQSDVLAQISSSVATGGTGGAIEGDRVVIPACAAPTKIAISSTSCIAGACTVTLASSINSTFAVGGASVIRDTSGGSDACNGEFTLTGASGTTLNYTNAGCTSNPTASTGVALGCSVGGNTAINQCWSTTLTLTAHVSLRGSDAPSPIVTIGSAGGGTTVLVDATNKLGHDNPLIKYNVSVSDNTCLDIGQFTVMNGGQDTGQTSAHVEVTSGTHCYRQHDMTFTDDNGNDPPTVTRFDGDMWGVIDHNTTHGAAQRGFFIRHHNWGGASYSNGDKSWASSDTIGTQMAMYVENNDFSANTNNSGTGNVSCEGGCRVGARHNNGTGLFLGEHGTESGHRERSAKEVVIDDNAVVDSTIGLVIANWHNIRGGTSIAVNNTITANQSGSYKTTGGAISGLEVINYCFTSYFTPWGPSNTAAACDGTRSWDNNANSGAFYDSGSVTSSTSTTLTDTSKTWTAHQWIGYSVHECNSSNCASPGGTAWGSIISDNTTNTLTFLTSAFGQSQPISNGDAYRIYQIMYALDSVGLGGSGAVLLAGGNDNTAPNMCNGSPCSGGWVNEPLDPVNEGGNTRNGSPISTIGVTSSTPLLSGNGTNSLFYDISVGVASSLPATCTPLQGFYETDANALMWCTSTNVWSIRYKPLIYTYPHPLVSGAPPVQIFGAPTVNGSVILR